MNKIMKFKNIPQFTRHARYKVDISWGYLEEWLKHLNERKELELNPDFQRAHIWTEQQQIRYVEFILKGGQSGKELFFNHPGWMNSYEGIMVLVDGKQRLEAVRKFMGNKLPILLGHYFSDFKDRLGVCDASFSTHVNNLSTRAEVLQWYIDLNAGGIAHTDEEIEKVRKLLKKEKE